MKKKTIGLLVILSLLVALAVGVFAFTSTAAADDGDQAVDNTPGYGWCHGGGGLGPGMMGTGWMGQANLNRIGNLLGMTPDQILEQQKAGNSLVDIAKSKGVGEDQLIDTMLQPMKEMMQVSVKYNYLNQSQVDDIVKSMTERIKSVVEAKGGPGNGPGFGPRGRRSSDDSNNWGPGPGGMMGGYGGYGGMMGGYGNGGGRGGMMGRYAW